MTTKVPAELSSTPSIVDNGDATAITIDSSENIGIGISSPSDNIHIFGNSSTPSVGIKLQTHDTANAQAGITLMSRNSSNVNVSATIKNVTTALQSSLGIAFGSDTAAANALDDYEEGTFTPNLKFGSTDNATTYDRTGQYTKIGNTVYVTIQLGFPNGVTTSDSGIAHISNLPFTSISGARHIGPLSPYGMSGFGNRPVCRVGGGSDILYLNDDHAGAFYVASDFATSAEMFMSITYQGA